MWKPLNLKEGLVKMYSMKTQQQPKGRIPGGRQPRKHAVKSHTVSKLRRRRLIEAALDGKPLRKVGLEMGLSPKTVDSQVSRIMKEPQVQQAFNRILEESGLDSKFLANKLRELLDAKTVLFFQHQGQVTDQREVPALETQRKTAELACRLYGYLKPDNTATSINNSGLFQVIIAQLSQDKNASQIPYAS